MSGRQGRVSRGSHFGAAPEARSAVVLRLDSFAGTTDHAEQVAKVVGKYLVNYDHGNPDLDLLVEVTPYIAQARRFTDTVEAGAYWRQQHGTRPDGRPNRPLTAFTVELLPAPEPGGCAICGADVQLPYVTPADPPFYPPEGGRHCQPCESWLAVGVDAMTEHHPTEGAP